MFYFDPNLHTVAAPFCCKNSRICHPQTSPVLIIHTVKTAKQGGRHVPVHFDRQPVIFKPYFIRPVAFAF